MKLRDIKTIISEMTYVDTAISVSILQQWFERNEDQLVNGHYIGDIEKYKIKTFTDFKSHIIFGLQNESEIIVTQIGGNFQNIKVLNNDKVFVIFNMFTLSDFSGQSLNAKLLHFLHSREGYDIIIDNLITEMNKKNFLKLSKVFHLKWLNMKTGEIEKFETTSSADNKFSYNGPTDWQIFIPQLVREKFRQDQLDEYYSHFHNPVNKDTLYFTMGSSYQFLNELKVD